MYDDGVFEGLGAAIDEVDIPVDGVALIEAHRLLDRLAARVSAADGEFDAASLWDADAATSMTAWLRVHAGMSAAEASRAASRARRLRALPVTAAAWADGSLSGGQVGAMLANLRDGDVERFAEHEAAIVPALVPLSVTETARAMRHWAALARDERDERDDAGEPERSLHLSELLDGRRVLNGDLDAEAGEVVATALTLATTDDTGPEPARTRATRRADALVDVCRFFLDHQHDHLGGRHRPHVNVIVRADDLRDGGTGEPAEFVSGAPLDRPGLDSLLCDSALHRVLVAGRSSILDYGTATRTFPVNLWNAVVVRDRHCRFPGSDRPPRWCEGHHVVPVEAGGPTTLANAALFCSRHHHRLHMPGWQAVLAVDGELTVTDPAGRVHVTRPADLAGLDPPLPVPRVA